MLSSLQFLIPAPAPICRSNKILGLSSATQPKNDNLAANNLNSSVLKHRLAGIPKCAASNEQNQIELPGGLRPELMPKHVALVIDGFRRWGKSKGLTVADGHEAGTRHLVKLASRFKKCGVEVLTIFVFQPGAWNRPKEEVEFLLKLADEAVQEYIEELMRADVRITGVGNRSRFPASLQDLAKSVEERAKNNKGPHIVLAADYSGRYDITEAAKRIAGKVKDGVLDVEDIDEAVFEQHLQTNGLDFPNPDLLIRTGGKKKISNFMLWQSAYTELYFSDKLFPDFNEQDAVDALAEYQRRQRRFGAN